MNQGDTAAAFAQDEEALRVMLTALRRWRCERGISQAEVARRMKCSKSAISMMENGRRGMTMLMLLRYARAVGTVPSIRVTADGSRELFRMALEALKDQDGAARVVPAEFLRLLSTCPDGDVTGENLLDACRISGFVREFRASPRERGQITPAFIRQVRVNASRDITAH